MPIASSHCKWRSQSPMIRPLVFGYYDRRARFTFEATPFLRLASAGSSCVRFLSAEGNALWRPLAIIITICAVTLAAQTTAPVVAVDKVWIEFPAVCSIKDEI